MIRSLTSRRLPLSSLIAALLLVVGVSTASAQSTETYDVDRFTELEMAVRGTAYVSQGGTQSVEITGSEDVLEDLDVRVRNGRLVVGYANRNWVEEYFTGNDDEVEVRVTMTGVNDLRTPISQTEEFYQALKFRGVNTVMLRFQEEYHGIWSKPSNFMRAQRYLVEWFENDGQIEGLTVPADDAE